MKLKRYDDFLKEDLTPMAGDVEDFTEEGPEVEEIPEVEPEMAPPIEDRTVNGLLPSEEMEPEEMEPEEEYQFQGSQLLEDLANRLGVKVENNQINYNGKKIEYFSETEAFAIDRKGKYKTVDEVVSQLEK